MTFSNKKCRLTICRKISGGTGRWRNLKKINKNYRIGTWQNQRKRQESDASAVTFRSVDRFRVNRSILLRSAAADFYRIFPLFKVSGIVSVLSRYTYFSIIPFRVRCKAFIADVRMNLKSTEGRPCVLSNLKLIFFVFFSRHLTRSSILSIAVL